MDKLNKFKVHELIQLCDDKNIKIPKGLKKKEIINLYLEHTKSSLTLELNNSEDDDDTTIIEHIVNETVNHVVDKNLDDEPVVVVDDEPVVVDDKPVVVDDKPVVVVDDEPVVVVDDDEPVVVDDDKPVVVVDDDEPVVVDNDEPVVVDNDEPVVVDNDIIGNFKLLNEKLVFLTHRIEELELKLDNKGVSADVGAADVGAADGADVGAADGADVGADDGAIDDVVVIDKLDDIIDKDVNFVGDDSVLRDYSVKFKDENIDLLNQLYTMGIRFNKILDVNCYDKGLIEYIKDRGYDIKGYILDKFFFENNYSDKIDISLSNIVDKEYDLILCANLLDLLSEDEIKEYYKNILRVSSNLIVIKVKESTRKIDRYTELFNEIVNEQTVFKIDRYVTNNLPVNVFILRKTIFSETS